jgi:hypothetical protein
VEQNLSFLGDNEMQKRNCPLKEKEVCTTKCAWFEDGDCVMIRIADALHDIAANT